MVCPDPNALLSFLQGTLPRDGADAVEAHLDGCEACHEALALLLRSHAVTAPATPRAHDREPRSELERGAILGRYLVLERLGRGAMGVVFVAYDPDLERKIALKLLNPERSAGADAAEARSRLVREARALAKLSHPNVIAVYDVGAIDDQVFIAMELVDGVPLSTWLRQAPRTRAEILDVFHQAGRGLDAAHAAGLVHRDFKPANVLVGAGDGRVRVLDFGLARVADGSEPAAPPSDGALAIDGELTRTGTLLGTPAYMAPEQRTGAAADARADQYSFCVALCEALTGARPAGHDDAALRSSRLTSWMQRVLKRGLAPTREARFPSLAALLSALEHDPALRRRRLLGAIALGALALIGVVGTRAIIRRGEQQCRGAETKLHGIWDEARRAALAARFHAVAAADGDAAFAESARLVDAWTAAWQAMRVDTCEATHLHREQSTELLDLRMQCLDNRLQDLRAATDVLAAADAAVVGRALDVASKLPRLGDCANATALRGLVPPPADAGTRRALDAVGERLAHARAEEQAGQYRHALALVRPLVDEARALGWAPLLAEALRVRGAVEDDVGDAGAETTLFEAVTAAELGRDDRTAVRARLGLAYAVGELGRREEALRWLGLAEAGLRRLGGDELLEAEVLNARGWVLDELGRLDEARRVRERVLAIRQRVLGPGHRDVGAALANLAVVAHDQWQLDEALAYNRRAYDIILKVRGPRHPDTAAVMQNLGDTLLDSGRPAEAREWMERALELRIGIYGREHREVALSHVDLGIVYRMLGDLDRALAEQELALRIYEKAVGPDGATLGWPLSEIGLIHLARHQPARALAPLERALKLPPRKVPQKPEVKWPLARALWESGVRGPRVAELLDEALAGYDARRPKEARDIAEITAWRRAHGVPTQASAAR